jgi:glutathione S-transferase
MPIIFHYGAGSAYAWRVWLALEHKGLPYDIKVISFAAGDNRKPEFLALNPRHKVPVLVDGSADDPLVLYESSAIVEYLDDAYADSGKRLFPGNARNRALTRRLVCEADNYFAPALDRVVQRVLFKSQADWDADKIDAARNGFVEELSLWHERIGGEFLAGDLSAADFTLYPMMAMALRCEKKKPDLELRSAIPAKLGAWMRRVETLPYFSKTWPAHWK